MNDINESSTTKNGGKFRLFIVSKIHDLHEIKLLEKIDKLWAVSF